MTVVFDLGSAVPRFSRAELEGLSGALLDVRLSRSTFMLKSSRFDSSSKRSPCQLHIPKGRGTANVGLETSTSPKSVKSPSRKHNRHRTDETITRGRVDG